MTWETLCGGSLVCGTTAKPRLVNQECWPCPIETPLMIVKNTITAAIVPPAARKATWLPHPTRSRRAQSPRILEPRIRFARRTHRGALTRRPDRRTYPTLHRDFVRLPQAAQIPSITSRLYECRQLLNT